MKETTAEFAEHIDRVEAALREYREVKEAHDRWIADWRLRHGIIASQPDEVPA